MEPVLKLLLFFVFFLAIAVGGYKAYAYFNERIISSRTGWQLLFNSGMLLLVNLLLLYGGGTLLLRIFFFLKN